jgi:galactonate dehydratase
VVSGLPRVEGGYVYPPEGAGLGVRLLDSVRHRGDATIRMSEA